MGAKRYAVQAQGQRLDNEIRDTVQCQKEKALLDF